MGQTASKETPKLVVENSTGAHISLSALPEAKRSQLISESSSVVHNLQINNDSVRTKSGSELLFKYDHYGNLISGNDLGSEWRQKTSVMAIDCEMVGVGALCDSALARVSIVNRHGFCVYDEFVKPKVPVTDYRTSKSGVREEDLVNALPHAVVLHEVDAILRDKVVVGHSVHNDFESLQFHHPATMTRDTAIYYKALLQKKNTPSLQQLTKELLKLKIQDGEHSSIVDAQVTMLLYLREEANWERALAQEILPTRVGQVQNFRAMQIFPRRNDLERDNEFVRPIQVDTPYNYLEDYLDTMFRLLREDFMKPLREGIRQYRKWQYTRDKKNMPTAVRVFEDVRIVIKSGSALETKGRQEIKIPVNQSHVDLTSTSEESRYLLNGSLLLFIPTLNGNGPLTAKAATVIRNCEQHDQQLQKGFLNVDFVRDGPSWTVRENTTFVVLESVAFFEAYRYALERLQVLNTKNMQLWKYILNPTLRISPIAGDYRLCDFSNQIIKSEFGPQYDWQDNVFPSAQQLGFSKGQYEAFHSAVTKDLAIVQGPPGTGKTFIAMQVIQFFLHNPSLLKENPILVVSNTNHSLDHLLEKVIMYTRKMAGNDALGDNLVLRLGGRSKSEVVSQVTVREKELKHAARMAAEDEQTRAENRLHAIEGLKCISVKTANDFPKVLKELRQAKAVIKPLKLGNGNTESHLASDPETRVFQEIEIAIGIIRCGDLSKATTALTTLRCMEHLSTLLDSLNAIVQLKKKECAGLSHVLPINKAIRQAKIIGATVCGSVKHKERFLNKLKPAMMIVEEAAHVVEATVVAGIPESCHRLVLIGDHQQLRPSTADHELTVTNHLDVSLMERLVRTAKKHGKKSWSQLEVQRRMRPEISELICPSIYPHLLDDPSCLKFPDVKGMEKNVFFLDHDANDTKAEGTTSFVNLQEADFLFNLCLYLIGQGNKPEKITIIATYLGQKFELEKRLWAARSNYFSKIRVCCVDGFQGEENDIILLSLVRSNDERNIGFLRSDNRVCVALSRAKHGLYIVGSMKGLASKSGTWAKINQKLVSRNSIGTKLRLKCAIHGLVTSVGIQGSHKPFEVLQYGKIRKCVCEIKSEPNPTRPEIKPTPQVVPVQSKKQSLPSFSKPIPKLIEPMKPGILKLDNTANQQTPKEKKAPSRKKFSCGHFCVCIGECKQKNHTNFKCQEKCNRKCNGGHKCTGDHLCFMYCQKLTECNNRVSVVCSACRENIKGVCSKLFPYYGKASKCEISKKMICDSCK